MSKPAAPNMTHGQAEDPPRIAVVGWGLVTPLGDGAWPTFRALLAGRTLADRAPGLPPDTAPLDLARALGCSAAVQHNMADPAVLLAERTIREAATMAGLPIEGLPIWLGTSKGAVAKLSNALGVGHPLNDDLARCVAMGPHAYLAEQLSRRVHSPVVSHHVAACSSGLVALDSARRALLHHSETPYALVASADAAITPALLASYQRLGVLGSVTAAEYNQRPLDERRQGFMLSEIGAAVLLKRLAPDEPTPDHAILLADTVTACEPYDIIRTPKNMRSLALLWQQLTANRSIDVIHPHAPGTREHDPAELDVLLQTSSPTSTDRPLVGAPSPPDVYAVKGAIGHGLGASGLASFVVAAMCLRSGRRPSMPWLSEPMKLPGGGRLETTPHARPCRRAGSHAVLAAGFGGHLAAALLQGTQPGPTDQGAASSSGNADSSCDPSMSGVPG